MPDVTRRFYIATRLDRAADARFVRDALVARGWAPSYDWTTHGSVQTDGEDRIRDVAAAELDGVTHAEIVVVLLPGGRGTHAELGAALAAWSTRVHPVYGPWRIILHSETDFLTLGDDGRTCAFYYHPAAERIVCPLADLPARI